MFLLPCSTSASEGEEEAAAAGGQSGRGMSSKAKAEALAIMRGLQAPPGDEEAAEGGEGEERGGKKDKKGLFGLPFMKRALEKQKQQVANQAVQLLEEFQGGEEGFGLGSGEGEGGAGGRRRFGGAAGAAAAEAEEELRRLEAGSSGEEEDAEAKAERLMGRGAAGRGEEAGRAAAAEEQQALHQQQQHKGRKGKAASAAPAAAAAGPGAVTMTAGFIDVELPQAAAGRGGNSTGKTVVVNAAAVAAAAAKAGNQAAWTKGKKGRGGDDWLFAGEGVRATAAGGVDAGEPGPSQEPGFLPSKTFKGAKEDYVFKRGNKGVGYYRDSTGGIGAGKTAGKAGKGKGVGKVKVKGAPPGVVVAADGVGESSDEEGGNEGQAAAAAGTAEAARKGSKKGGGRGGPIANGHHHQQLEDGDEQQQQQGMQLVQNDADLQRQLLQRAFAADDVAAEFEAAKEAEVAAELPKEDGPLVLPGWGVWAGQQKEPAWMIAARKKAEAAKAAAAAARKDAKLKHVVICEKWDKKASKYLAPQLPFPYTSAEVYESSIRQPLGRETNPDAAFRNLTRPAVLKDTGVVIEPIKFNKAVAKEGRSERGKARQVVSVAGGQVMMGQVPGSGAGGVGRKEGKAAVVGQGQGGGKQGNNRRPLHR